MNWFSRCRLWRVDIVVLSSQAHRNKKKCHLGWPMSKSVVIANVASTDFSSDPMTHVEDGPPRMATKLLATSHDGSSIVWVWECSAGSFVWHYGEDETVYIISGEVFISTDNGEERRLGQGDMAVFPGGVSCKWRVTAPVKKIAVTRKDLPFPVGFGVRAYHKLAQKLGLRRVSWEPAV
jgi:uncharacterized cupin superfamily protein